MNPNSLPLDVSQEDLPSIHPEDCIAEYGEIAFCGYYLYWHCALNTMSDAITEYVAPLPNRETIYIASNLLNRENDLQNWVNNARDYLPEWLEKFLTAKGE